MFFLSDIAEFAKIKVARKLHNRIVNGKVFAVKGSSFWRQGASKLFEKTGNKRRMFGTLENKNIRKLLTTTKPKTNGMMFSQKPPMDRFLDAGLSKLEARSLASYVLFESADINNYNFDSGINKELGVMKIYIDRGLQKLPRATYDNLPNYIDEKARKGKLIRSLRIEDDQLDSFLNGFVNADKVLTDTSRHKVEKGVVQFKQPLSTSVNDPYNFPNIVDVFSEFDPSTETQVKFKIKRKKTTNGRWIRDYTLPFGGDDGEVLFPSKSKFKISKVKEYESLKEPYGDTYSKPGYEIWLDEL